jgi:hypothetical protein
MAKKTPVVLIIADPANRSKLTFGSWEEAHEHIRTVILGQIIDELVELALQDDPSQLKKEIEDLRDIAHSVNYPRDEEELKDAVSQWNDYTDHATGFTTVEIL